MWKHELGMRRMRSRMHNEKVDALKLLLRNNIFVGISLAKKYASAVELFVT